MNDPVRCILAICRTPRDFRLLSRRTPGRPVVVATDDPSVESLATSMPGVVRVVPLEGSRSIEHVWERLRRITEQVNRYLLAQHKQYHPSVLKWIASPECHGTTGRLAELLLLVDAALNLMRHDVGTVMVVRRVATRWEDEILVEVATQLQKEVVQVQRPGYALTRWTRLADARWCWRGRELSVTLPERLLLLGKRARLLTDLLCRAITYPFVRRDDQARNVLLMLGSADPAHVEGTVRIQEAFERREGYDPLTVCWRAPRAYRTLRDIGLSAVQIESWYPLHAIAGLWREYRIARTLIDQAAAHYAGANFSYDRVDLVRLIAPMVERYARYELLERLALFQALSRFLESNDTAIVRTWERGVSPMGAICQFILGEIETRSGQKRPLTFDHMDAPLERYLALDTRRACDVLLVTGEHDRHLTRKRGGSTDNMIMAGFAGGNGVRQFAEQVCREDSAELLGVNRSPCCNIFYAPPPVRRGYFSMLERNRSATGLLKLARNYPEIAVLVQPPTHPELQHWRRLMRGEEPAPNVYLVEPGVPAYHCINFCDMMVTQVRALAFEAMEFGKPVIALSFDGEEHTLETYGDALLKFTDAEDFAAFLRFVLSDPHHLSVWRDAAVTRQNQFVASKISHPSQEVAEHMVERIVALIGREMTLQKTIRRKPPQAVLKPVRASAA